MRQAPHEVRSGGGGILLFFNIALLLLVTALTLFYCFRELRWSSVFVMGGVIFLFSPFVTQDLPEAFKAGTAGLAILALALSIALAILLGAGAQDLVLRAFTKS